MKKLLIVESPSKAKKIQEFLGDEFIVKASVGHIVNLGKGAVHGIGVDIKNNFKPKYVLESDKVAVLDDIMKAAKNVDEIYLAGDPDREGTAISWHLQERLKDLNKTFKRAMFFEIKKDKVLKALKEAGDIDMNTVHAQESRRILDRLVGFTASPFLMNCVGAKLSAGRVQSVVTRMIIDREKEIKNFTPETYFTILSTLVKNNQKVQFKYVKTLKKEDKALEVYNASNIKEYIITDVLSSEEKKFPPPPMITSTLQGIMSKDYNMDADKTMAAAQRLYETGFVSYIRTDSTRISDESMVELRDFIKQKYDLPAKPHIYKNKDAAQDAHECIRPTSITLEPDNQYAIIDDDEKLVYSVIYKYYIASQMNPAIYDVVKVTAVPENNQSFEFKTSGKTLKYKGFLEVLNDDESDKVLPEFLKNEKLKLDNIKNDKKQTQPPPRYSQYKLINELDKKNIGRPSTYADLLSKITTKNYVEKKGNIYHPTELGVKVTEILTKYFTFMNYNYTAELEKKLDEIEAGKLDHIQMLKDFYPSFKNEIDKAYVAMGVDLCKKCNFPIIERKNKNNQTFKACSNYPKCYNVLS